MCSSDLKSLDLTFPEVRLLGASKEEKATYYFATRQFEKGKTLIEELLRGGVSFPEHAESHMAKVLVVYFVRIKSDPNEAALFFKKLKKEKKRDWKFDIDGWIRDFENWGKEKAEDEFVLTKDELLRMSRRFLKRRNGNIACSLVNCLRASVYLHGLLEEAKSSKKGTGLALLWLGEIYERVGDPFFAPSADFFWKACISKFPHQVIAKKCFKKIVDFEKRKGLKKIGRAHV